MKNIFKLLNTDGFFIGIDWFSDEHSEFKKGEFIDDEKTKDFLEVNFILEIMEKYISLMKIRYGIILTKISNFYFLKKK